MRGVIMVTYRSRSWRRRVWTLDRALAGSVCLILLLVSGCTGGSGSGFGNNNSSSGNPGGGGGQVAAPRQYDPSTYGQVCYPPNAGATSPQIFYTDITSGPNSGGENNNGAYLTIFGKRFGATRGTSTVTINRVPVAAYKQWSDNRITVQPGSAVSSGPIVVSVAGPTSTQSTQGDHIFTVRQGHIYFISRAGDDGTGRPDDIDHPFATVQYTYAHADFSGAVHLVMRGGTWSDTSPDDSRFFFVFDNDRCGAAFDSVVLMGYPDETVLIQHPTGGINAWNCQGGYTVSGLVVDMQGGGGTPFGFPPGAAGHTGNTMQNIRAVNNEFTGMISSGGGSAAMEGRGHHIKYLGNRIHDNGIVNGHGASSKLYHAVYFDNNDCTGTDDVEIAYNAIGNQGGGRGIQIFNDPGRCAAGSVIANVSVHHNIVHDIALDGIEFGATSKTGNRAYDNVVYRTAVAAYQTDGAGGGCIRFDDPGLVAAVYNNTFSDCALDEDVDSAGIRFDQAAAGGISLVNNIVATSGGSGYFTGSPSGQLAVSNSNLWDASGAAPAWDASPEVGYPQFACFSHDDFSLHTLSPAVDRGSSMVSATVVDDVDRNPRPQGAGYDIGAYELVP